MAREVKLVLETINSGDGTPYLDLPCGTIWFSVSPKDANTTATWTLASYGETLEYIDVAWSSPENMPLESKAPNVIRVTCTAGDINITYIS